MYSHRSRALELKLCVSTLSCTRLLINMRALGVTVKRELTSLAVKSPYGKLTQLSATPGSSENCGTTPHRPL